MKSAQKRHASFFWISQKCISPVHGADRCIIRLWVLLDRLSNHNTPIRFQRCIGNIQTPHFFSTMANQSTDRKHITWEVCVFTSPLPQPFSPEVLVNKYTDSGPCSSQLWSKGTKSCLSGDDQLELFAVWCHVRRVFIGISSMQCSLLLSDFSDLRRAVWLVTELQKLGILRLTPWTARESCPLWFRQFGRLCSVWGSCWVWFRLWSG